MPVTPAARARIDAALHRIQTAQNEMERGCAELSTLRHIGKEWEKGHKLMLQIKAHWYKVEALRHSKKPITVDSEPE
jgi:hypothetical protein